MTVPRFRSLSVVGCEPHRRSLVKQYATYAAGLLLSRPLISNVCLSVAIGDDLTNTAFYGENDYGRAPREFDITLSNAPDYDLLIALGHEIVHVTQYALQSKRDIDNKTRFRSRLYEPSVAYEMRPWEIEAFAIERVIYSLWSTKAPCRRIFV